MSSSSPPPLKLVGKAPRAPKPPTDMGKRMEECREKLGLDQGEVVKRVAELQGKTGNRPATWHDWTTKDMRGMNALNLLYLARVLETSAEWLMLGEVPIAPTSAETAALVKRLKARLPEPMEAFDAQTLSSIRFYGREPNIKLLHVWHDLLTSLAPPRV